FLVEVLVAMPPPTSNVQPSSEDRCPPGIAAVILAHIFQHALLQARACVVHADNLSAARVGGVQYCDTSRKRGLHAVKRAVPREGSGCSFVEVCNYGVEDAVFHRIPGRLKRRASIAGAAS